MRGRRRLAVSLVTLLTVWASIALTPLRAPALAADPSLDEAVAQQRQLERTLADQRARLEELGSSRTTLESTLAQAEAELNAVVAEFDEVSAMLAEVRVQVADLEQQLAELNTQIEALDAELALVAADIERESEELAAREALLEDHMRDAYERSQTSFLEFVLSAPSLGEVTNQVGYLLTVSDRDRELADGIRESRAELRTQRRTLKDGRREAALARTAAEEQAATLAVRQQELSEMEARLEELRKETDARRAEQAASLQQVLLDEEQTQQIYEQNVAEHQAQEQLVQQLQAEAERRAREAEEARRREAERLAAEAAAAAAAADAAEAASRLSQLSARGFRWPMDSFVVTQEFGPTGFALEPPAYHKGTYYAHFHEGIDIAGPCGTPVLAASAGVVVASGRPNPASDGYGVVLSHGGSLQSWYWHLTTQVVVQPGQQVQSGQVIGYEGNTGFSTGCHLHFAINENGEWENPRNYLP